MKLLKMEKIIKQAIKNELIRIREGIELIPSENFPSIDVLQALSSVFTCKYSEGYPKKRYYGGNEFVDVIEEIAIERTKKLFNAEHVNVQPLSGSPANQAVFFALLNPGDKFMGLDLSCGGHLTHGSKVSFSGITYKCSSYFVDKKTETLDMDTIRKQAIKEKPKLILSGFSAYPRNIDFKEFQNICDEVGAYHLADIAHVAGLIISNLHNSPFPFTDVVTTTTHKTLRGPRGAIVMCKERYAEKIDKAVFPGIQGGPHDNMTAAKAVALGEALKPDFKEYNRQIIKNAKVLARELMGHGIKLVTGGTDTHLMIINLVQNGLIGKGKQIQDALEMASIYTNKNTIPFEPVSPFNPSGIRIGTPAITTRGFKESEMKEIAKGISMIINNFSNKKIILKVKESMLEICNQFPLYPELKEGYL